MSGRFYQLDDGPKEVHQTLPSEAGKEVQTRTHQTYAQSDHCQTLGLAEVLVALQKAELLLLQLSMPHSKILMLRYGCGCNFCCFL
jgi:hypothetical protein